MYQCIDQYELIDAYASISDAPAAAAAASVPQPKATASISSSSISDVNAVTPADASDAAANELIYLACRSYRKRKSGEVDLKQGAAVNVVQRELSGD